MKQRPAFFFLLSFVHVHGSWPSPPVLDSTIRPGEFCLIQVEESLIGRMLWSRHDRRPCALATSSGEREQPSIQTEGINGMLET